MEVNARIAEILSGAEEALRAEMGKRTDYGELGALLEVAKTLKQIRDDRAPAHATVANEKGPVSSDGMFRFEVESDILYRIGRKADGSLYQQQVEPGAFNRIVEAVGAMMSQGNRRVKATDVHKAIPDLPYYQVNATVSFLKAAKIFEGVAHGTKSIEAEAKAAWEGARKK